MPTATATPLEGLLQSSSMSCRSLCYNLWETLPNGMWNFFFSLLKTSFDWSFQLLWEGNHLQEGSLNSIAIKKKCLTVSASNSLPCQWAWAVNVGWAQVECSGESSGPFTPSQPLTNKPMEPIWKKLLSARWLRMWTYMKSMINTNGWRSCFFPDWFLKSEEGRGRRRDKHWCESET